MHPRPSPGMIPPPVAHFLPGLIAVLGLIAAATVVATLWQVPDKESARLMAAFVDHLAAGRGKAEALRLCLEGEARVPTSVIYVD